MVEIGKLPSKEHLKALERAEQLKINVAKSFEKAKLVRLEGERALNALNVSREKLQSLIDKEAVQAPEFCRERAKYVLEESKGLTLSSSPRELQGALISTDKAIYDLRAAIKEMELVRSQFESLRAEVTEFHTQQAKLFEQHTAFESTYAEKLKQANNLFDAHEYNDALLALHELNGQITAWQAEFTPETISVDNLQKRFQIVKHELDGYLANLNLKDDPQVATGLLAYGKGLGHLKAAQNDLAATSLATAERAVQAIRKTTELRTGLPRHACHTIIASRRRSDGRRSDFEIRQRDCRSGQQGCRGITTHRDTEDPIRERSSAHSQRLQREEARSAERPAEPEPADVPRRWKRCGLTSASWRMKRWNSWTFWARRFLKLT